MTDEGGRVKNRGARSEVRGTRGKGQGVRLRAVNSEQ